MRNLVLVIFIVPLLSQVPNTQLAPRMEDEWTRYLVNTEFQDGRTQEVFFDGTRCDILTKDMAIEVDWCGKWAEGVGQSLYYGRVSGRSPTLILLTKFGRDTKDDTKFVSRALIAAPQEIRVWWYDCNTRKFMNSMGPH